MVLTLSLSVLVLHCPVGEIWVAQQLQEQNYPFLPVCVVFSFVQTIVWRPVFGIFNVDTDVDAWNCTRGLHGHRKRVCTGSRLWEKNPLWYRGFEPASVLRLAFQSDALPTELSPPLSLTYSGDEERFDEGGGAGLS